mgnify:CR=1 FL=1
MKKALSFIITLTLAVSCFFAVQLTAQAATVASGSCGTNLSWTLDDSGTLTVSGSGNRMNDYYDNSPAPWYDYRTQIKKAVIPSGVANIGSRAFLDCTALVEVEWGTIDTIGDHAFMNCTSLKHAILPDSCTWVWTNVFENCTSLQSAYIGYVNSYAATVPQEFFKGCTSLAVLGLGTGISTLGTDCLSGCTALTCIISDNTSIQGTSYNVVGWSDRSGVCSDNTYSSSRLEWHFELSEARLYFTGSGDMTSYNNGSQPWQHFTGAVNTVDFSTADAKVSVSTTAFQGRDKIETVDFTNVYAVGWGAFAECYALKYADFKAPLTQIWNYAFANCTSLESITFEEGTDSLHIYPWAFNNCSGTTYWLNIPSNCTTIDDHAFWGTGFNYTHIMGSSVTIGDDAFGNGEGGYARFFGIGSANTGAYDFVKRMRDSNHYNWWYYCDSDNHTYTTVTVAPTCTEGGYDEYGCAYCDADKLKSNYTDALGHQYRYSGSSGLTLLYSCERCGATNLQLSAVEVQTLFEAALSTTAGATKYQQADYDARCDLLRDGVINAKDLDTLNAALATPDLDGKETTLDTATTYQTIEGFGASACWWSQDVGGWENAEDILKLLYSPTEGIGLNIYRYNLGGGSEDQHDTALYVAGARTHCFMQENGTYNWNNDANAMNCLSIANTLNPNLKVTLFANSAPYFMTKSGKTYGALEANTVTDDNGNTTTTYSGTENLDSSKFDAFAGYIVTCAEHFIDEGYNVTAVSPINEPEWDWSGWMLGNGEQSCNQEGCHYNEETARDFYNNAMVPALQNSSKLNGKVELEVWESGQMNHNWWWERFMNNCFSTEKPVTTSSGGCNGGTTTTGTEYADYNANIRSYVDTISTHSYWASTADREAAANLAATGQYFSEQNLKFRQTEYCQMNTDASTNVLGHIQAEGNTNGMTIDYGLALADIIYQDMTILNTTEWDWWTGCGRGVYPDSLVYIDDNNHDHIETAKRLWTLGNYSKFIDEGAVRIGVSTGNKFGTDLVTDTTYTWTSGENSGVDKNNYLEETAYLNPDGSIVIVYINNSDTLEYTTFTDSTYTHFDSYVTDANRNLKKYQSGSPAGAIYIPEKSVTTVVLSTATTHARSTEGAYLFTYFTGNGQSEQRVRFAVSEDGYNFTPLNGNNEVITQTKGTLNCRDPYIFKGQDDYYYLIATDMDASTNIWWGNSNTMVLWRSTDLVNWTDETIINMSEITGADDIQRCWAPQVFWDANEQKYMVYFGLASWSITQNVTSMYYCYTDDLLNQSHYSYPQLLFKSGTTFQNDQGETVQSSSIDGDIFYDSTSGTYYLYFKDEGNATICYVTSNNLTGPYSDAANPQRLINTDVGLEGCNAHRITGTDTIVMLADAYGDGYFVLCQATDYHTFTILPSNTYTINNCSPRHGSVIAISDDEYDRLVSQYGF